MNAARIAVLYTLIALAATCVNLACQALVGHLWTGPHAVSLSIAAGTVAGLPFKYVLEKRHIFDFRAETVVHDGETFLAYGALGGATTLVFWSVEFGFDALFGSEAMRYVGAIAGLSVGYALKYQLDKRYVFRPRLPAATRQWGH